MSDISGFLLRYPVWLIAKHSTEACQRDASLRQSYAYTFGTRRGETVEQTALMVFTEHELAERHMLYETVTGCVVPVNSHAELTAIVNRNRRHYTMLLIDPNCSTGFARSFTANEFADLES